MWVLAFVHVLGCVGPRVGEGLTPSPWAACRTPGAPVGLLEPGPGGVTGATVVERLQGDGSILTTWSGSDTFPRSTALIGAESRLFLRVGLDEDAELEVIASGQRDLCPVFPYLRVPLRITAWSPDELFTATGRLFVAADSDRPALWVIGAHDEAASLVGEVSDALREALEEDLRVQGRPGRVVGFGLSLVSSSSASVYLRAEGPDGTTTVYAVARGTWTVTEAP